MHDYLCIWKKISKLINPLAGQKAPELTEKNGILNNGHFDFFHKYFFSQQGHRVIQNAGYEVGKVKAKLNY